MWICYNRKSIKDRPVKLIQQVKIAHSVSQYVSNLFIYHFKLAYVVLHTAVKEFWKPASKNGERNEPFKSVFADRVILADLEISLIHLIQCGKYILNFHSHVTVTAYYAYMTHFFSFQKQKKSFKALDTNSAVFCN